MNIITNQSYLCLPALCFSLQLFLIQMDEITPKAVDGRNAIIQRVSCTSICINEPEVQLIGHTEDTLQDALNHFYLVSAHIKEETPQGRYGVTEERFTSLCYAGQLPGYTMGYNHHGLVLTINTLSAKLLKSGKTPRTFITRAMLAAENFEEAQKIMRDNGVGAADGCSLNMTFLKQEGSRLFHNAEMGPAVDGQPQSQLNILTASSGEHLVHVNKWVHEFLSLNLFKSTQLPLYLQIRSNACPRGRWNDHLPE